MKLYDFAFSPNCRKVRAAAYELGITLETVHVDLLNGEQRTAAYLRINPNGRVPVLVDRDFVLFESTAIMRYLSAKQGGALVPATLEGRADVDRWMAWQVAHLGPAMGKVAFERIVKKLTRQGPPDEAAIAVGSQEYATLSGIMDRALEGPPHQAPRSISWSPSSSSQRAMAQSPQSIISCCRRSSHCSKCRGSFGLCEHRARANQTRARSLLSYWLP
jgi:glutathione S-transferase